MVSPDKLKKEKEEYSKLARNKNSRKKRKPSSLLKSKKFFLTFKNFSLQTKLERQLKNFGGIIIPYIDKEVNYVLTDAPGYNGKSSVVAETSSIISPQCYSVSPATSISGDDSCTVRKSRTRTEAMLEKISAQTQSLSAINNPISTAISWNIPVYSVDYFQNLLSKKLAQTQLTNGRTESKNDKNVRIFEKKYLKLEHIVSHKYRPEFKEVSKWPFIDTNTLAGTSPFEKKSSKKSTRKEKNHADKKDSQRMNRTCNKTANESGYCEICAVHYSDLSQHVTTSAHLKFICNDRNYADLDNCIKTRSVEAFLAAHQSGGSNSKESHTNDVMGRNLRKSVTLHLNNNNENSSVTRSLSNAKLLNDESLKQPLQVQCNGFTNYHLRKSAIKSDPVLMKSPSCYTSKDLLRETRKMYSSCPDGSSSPTLAKDQSHLSPVEEENLHRLRSRKNLLLPAILMGTTAEDSGKNNKTLSPHTPNSNHFLRSSSSPKLQCQPTTRSKPLSEDGYKKSNITNSSSPTLNKNGPALHFTRSKLNNLSPCENESRKLLSPKEKDDVRANGKPCKRKSSLVVSDEEEKPEAKMTRASASPRQVPSYQCNKKLKNNVCSETSENSAEKAQRKRMSLEEKFLQDNQEYYKVEVLRTKLRSTEFYVNQEMSHTDTKKDESQPEPKKQTDTEEVALTRFQKNRQRRQSALHILSLEANNFLYGPPKNELKCDNEAGGDNKVGDSEVSSEEAHETKTETSGPTLAERCSTVAQEKRTTERCNSVQDRKMLERCNSTPQEKKLLERNNSVTQEKKVMEKCSSTAQEKRGLERGALTTQDKKATEKCTSTSQEKKVLDKSMSQEKRSVERSDSKSQEKKLKDKCNSTPQDRKTSERSSTTSHEKKSTERCNPTPPEKKVSDRCGSTLQERKAAERSNVTLQEKKSERCSSTSQEKKTSERYSSKTTEKSNSTPQEKKVVERYHSTPQERKTSERSSSAPRERKLTEKGNSALQNSISKQNGRRSKTGKRRRTQAEAFIHDNLDYYKFEISGSRLRHQNADEVTNGVVIKDEPGKNSCSTPLQESPSCSVRTPAKVKEEVITDDETVQTPPVAIRRRGKKKKREPVDELPPLLPPALSPQPTSLVIKEELETASSLAILTAENVPSESYCCMRPPPPDSIHFSFESVPCKEPWFKTFQRLDSCNERYLYIPNTVYFSRYRDVPPIGIRRRLQLADAHTALTNSPSSRENSMFSLLRRKRRSRFTRFIIDDKPRKSPRCHASTLAILSSLGRRRSRKLLTAAASTAAATAAAVAAITASSPATTSTPIVTSLDQTKVPPSTGAESPVANISVGANANASVPLISVDPTNAVVPVRTDLENRALLLAANREYQARLREAVAAMAKEVDEHLIQVFSSEDCDDRYLKTINPPTEANSRPMVNGEIENGSTHCCMQIDPEIFHDEEFLECLIGDAVYTIDDMAAFFESSLRCVSMDVVQDEDAMAPRSQHETLTRLYRENDFSCNSSDCGASSTCEFLGFAEDGRTVSRKRKRKRPNMTGWPHDRSKRRQMRTLRGGLRRTHGRDSAETTELAASPVAVPEVAAASVVTDETKEADTMERVNDTVSEADSECTDDDIPLKEFLCRKKRRTNSSLSSNEGTEAKAAQAATATPVNDEAVTPTRRSSKAAASLPNSRRSSQTARRKSSSSSYPSRKVR